MKVELTKSRSQYSPVDLVAGITTLMEIIVGSFEYILKKILRL